MNHNNTPMRAGMGLTFLVLAGCPSASDPCEWTIVNSTNFELTEITVSEDLGGITTTFDALGGDTLAHGDDVIVTVNGGGAVFDLDAVDVDGDSYRIEGANICVNGEPLLTSLTLDDLTGTVPTPPTSTFRPCEWFVTNDTGFDWLYFYARTEGESDWGDDLLGAYLLYDTESISFMVPAGPYWDLQAEDVDNDTYTRLADDFCFDGEDLSTTFTISDID